MSVPVNDDAILSSLEKLPALTYVQVAACTLVVYDYALTFTDEVQLIWPARWNLGKILFFLTRYPPFFGLFLSLYSLVQRRPDLSNGACSVLRKTDGCIAFLGIIVAEVILAIRVFALWRGTFKVAVFIAVVSCVCLAGASAIFSLSVQNWDYIALYQSSGKFGGCIHSSLREATHVYSSVAVAHGIVAVLELLLFVMTCMSGLLRFGDRSHRTSFVKTFYKDGIIYFLLSFMLSLTSVPVTLSKNIPAEYLPILMPAQYGLHSILTSRMSLHLRREMSPSSVTTVPSIEFARHQSTIEICDI